MNQIDTYMCNYQRWGSNQLQMIFGKELEVLVRYPKELLGAYSLLQDLKSILFSYKKIWSS